MVGTKPVKLAHPRTSYKVTHLPTLVHFDTFSGVMDSIAAGILQGFRGTPVFGVSSRAVVRIDFTWTPLVHACVKCLELTIAFKNKNKIHLVAMCTSWKYLHWLQMCACIQIHAPPTSCTSHTHMFIYIYTYSSTQTHTCRNVRLLLYTHIHT